MSTQTDRLWAVDPGGVHVGLAEFSCFAGTKGTWQCDRAWETDPEDAIDRIAAALLHDHIGTLVVEEFRLYPDKAMAQTGSTMPTCELIGQIKWAHRLNERRLGGAGTVKLVLQPAAIQDPTLGVLRKRKIKSVAKQSRREIVAAGGEGDHALSAELHGWHHIIRTLKAQPAAG